MWFWWLSLGVLLCAIEFVVPTAFVSFVMGLSAIAVALISLAVGAPSLQVLLWMGLSGGLLWAAQRWVNRPGASPRLDAVEAETMGEIAAGRSGRVLYEGQSWAARCEDETQVIAPGQRVYVTGRRGTTLLVIPAQGWGDRSLEAHSLGDSSLSDQALADQTLADRTSTDRKNEP